MEPLVNPRRPRNYKAGFLIMAVGVLLLVMMLWMYDSLGAADLNKAVREAQALGGPLTLEDLINSRRKWAEGENGADVVLAIQSKLQPTSTDEFKGLPLLDYATKPELGRRWSPETLDQVRKHLEAAAPQLAQIDTLARYEGGAFPLAIATDPTSTLLPALGPMRSSARLKALQAQYRMMQGETVHLAGDVDVLLHHARLVADEPTLISALVANACDSLAMRTIECGLAVRAVSGDELGRIQQMLVVPDVRARLDWAVRSERAFFLAAADYFRSTGIMPGGGGGGSFPAMRIPGAHGWIMKDEARGLKMFNRLLSAADAAGMRKEAKTIEQELAGGGSVNVLTTGLMPSFSRAMNLITQRAAEIACTRVGLAAERYRLDHNCWPAKLVELVPAYIDRIPDDPFTGKPIRMAARDGRLVIYSVGMDEQDNAGRVLRGRDESNSPDCGFILFDPDQRNQPPAPETAPASESQPAL